MLKNKLGETLKKRRKELKLTQPHLAELANVSTNMLYKIEKGQVNPSIGVIQKIADVMGMELILKVKTNKFNE